LGYYIFEGTPATSWPGACCSTSVPFLRKPFSPDELEERVQELLELRARGPDD
jgi:hypothetical protein